MMGLILGKCVRHLEGDLWREMLSGCALWFDVKSGQAFVCVVMLDDASLCDLNPVWEDKGRVLP